MARSKGIANIEKDLTGNLDRDFNILIRGILSDLSSEQKAISPIDTGFFISSWTAGTQRPRPDEARESVAPWSSLKPNRKGGRAIGSTVQPRFINNINYNFKPFSKVFIGNRSQYAARALASTRSQVPQYVQGKLRDLIQKTFSEKRSKLAVATFGTGVRGDGPNPNVRFTQGLGAFSDPNKVFVDYETP